jgi:hypothetical protein
VVVVYLVGAAVGSRLGQLGGRALLDGFAPPPPYDWVSPPPDLAPSNHQPSAGHFTVALEPATGSRARVLSTADSQVSLAIQQGAIAPRSGQTSVAFAIVPLAAAATASVPDSLQIAGNVYRITATYQPGGSSVPRLRRAGRLVMAYPILASPSYHHVVLRSADRTSFTKLESTDHIVPQLAQANVTDLGSFAVGQLPLGSPTTSKASGRRTISIVVIIAGLAVLAAVVIAEVRRRARRRDRPRRRPAAPRRRPAPRRRDPWD